LTDLIDLSKDKCVGLPERLEEVGFLTPFAVEFRYDFYEEDEDPVDFEQIFALLVELREWVISIVFKSSEPRQ
jgi:hypothetical protein